MGTNQDSTDVFTGEKRTILGPSSLPYSKTLYSSLDKKNAESYLVLPRECPFSQPDENRFSLGLLDRSTKDRDHRQSQCRDVQISLGVTTGATIGSRRLIVAGVPK